MIVSHKYRFIFLKTGKVGGTSLEIALSKFLGEEDIITPISREDERLRLELGFLTAQNFHKPPREMGIPELLKYFAYKIKSGLVSEADRWKAARDLPRKYRNHIPARELRPLLGEEIWNSYYKFTVERNPWDKTVSVYSWDPKGKNQSISFREFVASGKAYDSNFEIYAIDGIPQVDRIVRYETLEEDLGVVSREIGLPENIYDVMRHIKAKGGYRRGAGYREHFDEYLKNLVSVQYAREIELLGYDF